MAYYDLISENDESTVVAEFEKGIQWLDDMQPMLLAAKPMMDLMNAVIDDYE